MSATELVTAGGGGGSLDRSLTQIAGRASALDQSPRFPFENFQDLQSSGVLRERPADYRQELALVRAVATADASTARILDGHLNGIERLALADRDDLRDELRAVLENDLLVGVWGADPIGGEGDPARLVSAPSGSVLQGVKTFCSGVGGVDRALVVAADAEGARRLVYVDAASDTVKINRVWYRASGLRASESHLVEFCGTPVLAVIGGPDELAREPFFSRDAIRTAATWAGLVDAIMTQTLLHVGDLGPQAHLLGEARVAAATLDRWLDYTAALLSDHAGNQRLGQTISTALECRIAMSANARSVLELSADICGSRALVGHSTLDRARRDLDLFLRQHRLSSKLAVLGTQLAAGGFVA